MLFLYLTDEGRTFFFNASVRRIDSMFRVGRTFVSRFSCTAGTFDADDDSRTFFFFFFLIYCTECMYFAVSLCSQSCAKNARSEQHEIRSYADEALRIMRCDNST